MILTWWRPTFLHVWCCLDKKSHSIVTRSTWAARHDHHQRSGWPSTGQDITCTLHWLHLAGQCTSCPSHSWCSHCGVYTMSAGHLHNSSYQLMNAVFCIIRCFHIVYVILNSRCLSDLSDLSLCIFTVCFAFDKVLLKNSTTTTTFCHIFSEEFLSMSCIRYYLPGS